MCQWSEFSNWTVGEGESTTHGKKGSQTEYEYGYFANTNELKISYDQNSENVSIEITHNGSVAFELQIVDINGNVVLNETGTIQNLHSNFVYPLHNLPTGSYFYRFLVDGMQIYASKFIVVK